MRADFSAAGHSETLQPGAVGPRRPTPDLEAPRRTSCVIWPLAAIGAVLIHAGCVTLALQYLQSDEADEDLGAPAIEVGLDWMAPRLDPNNLPPGPEADASAASPAVMEQRTVAEETELPKATPTETEDPARLVAPQAPKKPENDDPKALAVEAAPSEPSVAAEATAMPSPQAAPEAPRSVAPALGTGESLRRARATWQKELAAHLDRYKRYPGDRSQQGAEVAVNFVLDRAGHVVSASIAKSSGDAAFDDAVLTMMRRADPVPPPPPLIADQGLSFTLPVIFRAKARN